MKQSDLVSFSFRLYDVKALAAQNECRPTERENHLTPKRSELNVDSDTQCLSLLITSVCLTLTEVLVQQKDRCVITAVAILKLGSGKI